MNFRPELAAAVMAGTKTVTRRGMSDKLFSPWFKGACSLKVGRDYAVCPGRSKVQIGRVRIVEVKRVPLGHLTRAEAEAEGFASAREFEDAWREINGSYDPQALVWRVRFEVVA